MPREGVFDIVSERTSSEYARFKVQTVIDLSEAQQLKIFSSVLHHIAVNATLSSTLIFFLLKMTKVILSTRQYLNY